MPANAASIGTGLRKDRTTARRAHRQYSATPALASTGPTAGTVHAPARSAAPAPARTVYVSTAHRDVGWPRRESRSAAAGYFVAVRRPTAVTTSRSSTAKPAVPQPASGNRAASAPAVTTPRRTPRHARTTATLSRTRRTRDTGTLNHTTTPPSSNAHAFAATDDPPEIIATESSAVALISGGTSVAANAWAFDEGGVVVWLSAPVSVVRLVLLRVAVVLACLGVLLGCLLYTSPSPRDRQKSRMPSSA